MTYDQPITILELPSDVGTPVQGKLRKVKFLYGAEREVYHRRYWESVQAGSRIDTMVEIPLHHCRIDAGMFAQYKGHIYSIEQIQIGTDDMGLNITTLSLKRSEVQYDIAGA